MAIDVPQQGLIDNGRVASRGPEGELISKLNKRRQRARHERRKYEPTWAMCEHFLAGRQWVAWAKGGRGVGRVVTEPNPQERERYTINLITQYVETMQGKLFVEDLRPTVVFTRQDQESEDVTSHTRAMARFLWESELAAEGELYDMIKAMLTYGTAAVRCYYDSMKGEEIGEFPIGPDGKPIVDPQAAREFVAMMQQQGQYAQLVPIREGKVAWENLTPRQILWPPGVKREKNFPWLIVERPLPLDKIKEKWPDTGERVKEQDLVSANTSGVAGDTIDGDLSGAPSGGGKIKEHAVVSTCYELPCPDYPQGMTVNWVADQSVLLDAEQSLPYKLRSEPSHGIIFFHYHRLPHRFMSRGLIEDLIGPQRNKNKTRSQNIEMKDRNLGRVYAKKGTLTSANKPVGKIMEIIEIPLHAEFPQETQGVPPGPWIENEARMCDEDMERAAGLRDVSLGQAPTGVSAYSAMALLAEQDERRVGPVLKMMRIGIGELTVLSLELARRYWQEGKQLAITGLSGTLEFSTFVRANLPMEFYVDVSRHSPLPTSPAVESQKIFDLFHAATSAGQPLPIDWLQESLEQGRALPIPKREEEIHKGRADLENIMLQRGEMVQPAYYDDDFVHIMSHRTAQIEFMMKPEIAQFFEYHIQMHMQNAQMKHPTQGGPPGVQVPQLQGGHGVEAQNAANVNPQGAAQSAAGEAPLRQPAQ